MIGLATELLIGRYIIPEPTHPGCLLAQHERGVISDLDEARKNISKHRSDDYNRQIFPHLRPMVVTIGQRMAYEAALNAGVDKDLLALYEVGAIKSDSVWYSENMNIGRVEQSRNECQALDAVLPRLDEHLESLGIEPYCTAPMLSSDRWQGLVSAVPTYTGNADTRFTGAQMMTSKL